MMYGSGYNGLGSCFGWGSRFMFGGMGMLMMAVFALLVVLLVVYLAKRNGKHPSSNEALESLKMRFAKGEISEAEFLRRKNILD